VCVSVKDVQLIITMQENVYLMKLIISLIQSLTYHKWGNTCNISKINIQVYILSCLQVFAIRVFG